MTEKKSFVSQKVKNIPYSGIRKFFDIASEMEDVVSLGVGEPDFDTPWPVRERCIYTLEKGRTTYTSNAGLLELRKEISLYMKRNFDLTYDPQTQVLVTVGGSEAIDGVLRAVIEPGDEVLVVEPCFVAYKPCVELAGGKAIAITTKVENEFRLTAEELIENITDKTKVLMISYPNNPTGAIMEKEDLQKLVDVLKDKDILVISDEIYAELTYGDRQHVSIASFKEMYDKTLVINGFSKAFAMTGWRLGFATGSPDLIAAMTKIHQYAIMCAPTMSQYSAVEALKNCGDSVIKMRKAYDGRRRILIKGFSDIGMDCFEPLGAFYVFPSIQKTGLTSEQFCENLLQEEKVAVVPGNAFGDCGEGFVRCSYAYSIEELQKALGRIANFVERYK